jgi:predicted phosphodiesterase
MLVRLYSDLHLEFGDFEIPSMKDEDKTVLVLAGDITVGDRHKQFVLDACERFKHVIYVHGNHEYYKNEYNSVIKNWKTIADTVDNLHFLHNEVVIIDNTRFLGGTMWTDFKKSDWFSMYYAKKNMSCFSSIKYNNGMFRKLLPEDTVVFHNEFRDFLNDGNTVVITHHLPIQQCVSEEFRGSKLNPAFHANMEDILEKYSIDYWFYGHTHTSSSISVFDTVLVNNSRGYLGYEDSNALGFNEYLIFDI